MRNPLMLVLGAALAGILACPASAQEPAAPAAAPAPVAVPRAMSVALPATAFAGAIALQNRPPAGNPEAARLFGAGGPSSSAVPLIGAAVPIASPLTGSLLSPIIGSLGVLNPAPAAAVAPANQAGVKPQPARPNAPFTLQTLAVPSYRLQPLSLPALNPAGGGGASYGPTVLGRGKPKPR